MFSFKSIEDIGSSIQASVSYSVGLFDSTAVKLYTRLISMFIIYFNSILQFAINARKNNSLEYRGILASFILAILLFFPNIRYQFTRYLQSSSGVNLPYIVSIIYTITGSYTYSKFSNTFKFILPKVIPTKLCLIFLVTLRTYIRSPILVSNFILGKKYLQDTEMLIDVLIDILEDPNFAWTSPELLFDILVESTHFLFHELGLKTETVTGFESQSTISIFAMTFYEGIIFYKSEINSEVYLFLICVVFEIRSTVCIKLNYVLRCLSPWDARIKPNYKWDIYWRAFTSYCLSGSYTFDHLGIKSVVNIGDLDKIVTDSVTYVDSKLIPTNEELEKISLSESDPSSDSVPPLDGPSDSNNKVD